MRNIRLFSLIIVCALLQLCFFGAMRPFGIIPNLAIIMLASLSVVLSDSELVLAGASIGIIFDLTAGSDFGLRTTFFILFALILLVIRQMGGDFEYWPATIIAIVLGSLAYNVAIVSSLLSAGQAVTPLQYIGLALREMVCDIIIALLVRRLLTQSLSEAGSSQLIRRF